ncbi:MAG: S-adenosylmethionine:tRNA ribosyltransferase-isomerase [Bacteroidales bacterium]|nr:S-adenosylmethionine:tRNA ribosyltransferase-isomerase [Candidatus Liminaster caballi]
MINPRDIKISCYDYELPDHRIAKYPLEVRDQSKLLVYDCGEKSIDERHFFNLPEIVPEGSMMVFNNTKVIQARLHFRKPTGGVVEVFCLEPELPKDYQQNFASEKECVWTCLVGNSKKWKEGSLSLPIALADGRTTTLYCERAGEPGPSQKIRFYWEGGIAFAQLLDAIGELPIPPYLNRETEEKDKDTYQTVYSRIKGSVAAPTAGLHYTDRVLDALKAKDISLQYLTLHVGAGTFKPVKSETIEGHDMHTEFISVPLDVIRNIACFIDTRRPGAKFVATGTTSVRTLESLYYIGEKIAANPEAQAEELVVHQWEPYDSRHTMTIGESLGHIIAYLERHGLDSLVTATQILISPGFEYRLVDAIVTNFHMPQSTLLLLVSAFVDDPEKALTIDANWRRIYGYALSHDFRFLSYGDSSILLR